MSARPILAIATMLALAACDRSKPTPVPEPTPTTTVFENAAAGQSIMRPAVIAETSPTPTPTPTPTPPTSVTIAFPAGSTLDDAGRAALDQLLVAPGLPAGASFVLRGHSDSMGSDRENLVTSRKRAEAVAAYLEQQGIAAERITVVALGERRPVAPSAHLDGSDDPEGRAKNRRVVVEVVAPTATAIQQNAPRNEDSPTPS